MSVFVVAWCRFQGRGAEEPHSPRREAEKHKHTACLLIRACLHVSLNPFPVLPSLPLHPCRQLPPVSSLFLRLLRHSSCVSSHPLFVCISSPIVCYLSCVSPFHLRLFPPPMSLFFCVPPTLSVPSMFPPLLLGFPPSLFSFLPFVYRFPPECSLYSVFLPCVLLGGSKEKM